MQLTRRHATVPRTLLAVLAAVLFVSASAVQLDRLEKRAAAHEQRRPLSVVMHPVRDLPRRHVAPGCGSPQPGAPVGNPDPERNGTPRIGPSVVPAGRRSGSCVLIWLP
ncbi:hypothetical protein AB0C12_34560 [Actinoplanes sp. NPDC048967]|uniref:hypothetical protein n=1 Tax=Actinoplanes sp. NPDC048967 TaxID=3155269 RepID=UPI0033FB28B6